MIEPVCYVASVRIDLLRRIADTNPLLAPEERVLFARAATDRRRMEFVGGRLAAKLAAILATGVAFELASVPVTARPDGVRTCAGVCVSISHTRGLAVAVSRSGRGRVGIDIETAAPVEWIVREAIGKLTGSGVIEPLAAGTVPPIIVAAGRWKQYMMALAMTSREETD